MNVVLYTLTLTTWSAFVFIVGYSTGVQRRND